MAKQVQTTWGDRVREEGRQEGRQEGVLRGKRDSVLRVLRSRFRDVPEALARRIEAIQAEAELERLLDQAATVSHPDEMRTFFPS